METNRERVIQRIKTLASFTDTPGQGVSRFSYGAKDLEARAYLTEILEKLELKVWVDGLGNIHARMEGRHPLPPLMLGSHLDSVRCGGCYDGILGVVGAIEVLQVLKENDLVPVRPIEMVAFAEEEGSNFGTTMVGSKGLVGKYGVAKLQELKNADGKSCLDILTECGYLTAHKEEEQLLELRINEGDVFGMLELHIEQGVVLEREQKKLGLVQAIAGMRTIEVTVRGQSNHAGATPMHLRKDPMVAAASIILALREIARYEATAHTVATVGKLQCEPDMPNVIPETVIFTVDIRDVSNQGIQLVTESLNREISRAIRKEGVEITTRVIGESDCILLSPEMVGLAEDAARALEVPYKRMNSGAVHDSAMMAEITKVGMIFVPSKDGMSHNQKEFTEEEDIKIGCDALLLCTWALTCRE